MQIRHTFTALSITGAREISTNPSFYLGEFTHPHGPHSVRSYVRSFSKHKRLDVPVRIWFRRNSSTQLFSGTVDPSGLVSTSRTRALTHVSALILLLIAPDPLAM